MRALIVDDSSFIRDYLRQLLHRMGITCEEAVNGSNALEVLAATMTVRRVAAEFFRFFTAVRLARVRRGKPRRCPVPREARAAGFAMRASNA
jgi:CheY-like chemotaxis protein